MKRWIAIAIAAAFAATAFAQTAVPGTGSSKERQDAVKSTTEAAAASTTGAQTAKQGAANVQASKQTAKMTTDEKNKAIKETNKKMVNPENPSGVAGTAEQQKANVAASKGQPKQTQKINTLGPKSEMQKAATQ